MLESTFEPTKEQNMDPTYSSFPAALIVINGEESPQHCCAQHLVPKRLTLQLTWRFPGPGSWILDPVDVDLVAGKPR